MPLELAIILPTFNERLNLPTLIARLAATLTGIPYELIIVDDHSPDGTADLARTLALTDPHIRILERIHRRGLSSACIEGMLSTAAPYLAVMDADLQHDETILPAMLAKIHSEPLDIVIASRRIAGGSMGEFAPKRVKLSNLGTRIGRLVARADVTDAMSGFFLVEAGFFRALAPRLTGSGFKLLLDILASSPTPPRTAELPYMFRTRQLGESKLDVNVGLEYLFLILDKLLGRWLPTRFVLFAFVGALGVLVHLAVLAPLYLSHLYTFTRAQAVATFVTMTFNFVLNNLITFRDRRLHGRRLALGLLTFYAACSLGAVINVAFATLLISRGLPWYLAGICGTIISSVWNYGANTVLTWRRTRP